MELITVQRAELLTKIQANRDGHRQTFEDAQEVYREQMIAEFERMLAEARDGKPIRRGVTMPEPEDHTKDYDRVIAMLQMSVDETIELDESDFGQYVLDEWGWQRSFATSTAAYAAQNVHKGR